MPVVLPDTSVWVDFSRRGRRGDAAALAELLDAGEVATCGPVAAELLAGAEGEVAERMWETLSSLPWAQLDQAAWREVGATARRLRAGGQTLPLTDVAIDRRRSSCRSRPLGPRHRLRAHRRRPRRPPALRARPGRSG